MHNSREDVLEAELVVGDIVVVKPHSSDIGPPGGAVKQTWTGPSKDTVTLHGLEIDDEVGVVLSVSDIVRNEDIIATVAEPSLGLFGDLEKLFD